MIVKLNFKTADDQEALQAAVPINYWLGNAPGSVTLDIREVQSVHDPIAKQIVYYAIEIGKFIVCFDASALAVGPDSRRDRRWNEPEMTLHDVCNVRCTKKVWLSDNAYIGMPIDVLPPAQQ